MFSSHHFNRSIQFQFTFLHTVDLQSYAFFHCTRASSNSSAHSSSNSNFSLIIRSLSSNSVFTSFILIRQLSIILHVFIQFFIVYFYLLVPIYCVVTYMISTISIVTTPPVDFLLKVWLFLYRPATSFTLYLILEKSSHQPSQHLDNLESPEIYKHPTAINDPQTGQSILLASRTIIQFVPIVLLAWARAVSVNKRRATQYLPW